MKTTIAVLLFAVFAACSSCATTPKPDAGLCPVTCYQVKAKYNEETGQIEKSGPTCDPSCYAYDASVVTKAECESLCASYGYGVIGVNATTGGCECDTSTCARPQSKGGCEKLPVSPR